jgi:hypothetical protein
LGGIENGKWKIMATERAVFTTYHFQLTIFHSPEGTALAHLREISYGVPMSDMQENGGRRFAAA